MPELSSERKQQIIVYILNIAANALPLEHQLQERLGVYTNVLTPEEIAYAEAAMTELVAHFRMDADQVEAGQKSGIISMHSVF